MMEPVEHVMKAVSLSPRKMHTCIHLGGPQNPWTPIYREHSQWTMTSSATKVTFYKEQMKEGLNLKRKKSRKDNMAAGIWRPSKHNLMFVPLVSPLLGVTSLVSPVIVSCPSSVSVAPWVCCNSNHKILSLYPKGLTGAPLRLETLKKKKKAGLESPLLIPASSLLCKNHCQLMGHTKPGDRLALATGPCTNHQWVSPSPVLTATTL